jgi:outer membrane protein OmpA-like peptidoglycan-associated protein
MKRTAIYLILLLPFIGWGQSTNISTLFHKSVKKADIYFNHFAYRNALHLYMHALDKDPKDTYIMQQIAECHFKLHNPVEAEKWYRKFIETESVKKEIKFDFAETLCMTGNYMEAGKWYEDILKEDPGNKMVREKLSFVRNIEYYELDSLEFVVTPVDFNTNHSDFGAHLFRDGMVFSSSRDLSWFIKHRPFNAVDQDESLLNLFYVQGNKPGAFGSVGLLHEEKMKSILHEGPIAFFDNYQKAAFTRTNVKGIKLEYDKDRKAHLQIFLADINAERELVNIKAFQYNSNEYSLAHPSLTPDGKTMFFTSTATGGAGGSDIYYSNFLNGTWTVPVNIGTEVNTPGDESFPYIANDTTLYFSSNGHGSLGGLDILVSYRRNGGFTKPVNFGGPLNTRFDDFSFVADNQLRTGYISSNRTGGKGLDDIYYFMVNNFFLKGYIVMDGEKVPGATVKIIDAETGEEKNVNANDRGFFDVLLPFDKKLYLIGEKEGYGPSDKILISTLGKGLNIDSLTLKLKPGLITAKGKIFSKETQQPLTGVILSALNITDNLNDRLVISDPSGYEYPLMRGKVYKLEFSKPGYVTASFEINTGDIKAQSVLNDIVLEEAFENTLVINFNYNSASLTPESVKSLKAFSELMKKNPELNLNIAAHADSRGTAEYNLELTNRRAMSARKYFLSTGISESRITWKGFGEELILNKCSEGVKCPESEHKINRRAEIKIRK